MLTTSREKALYSGRELRDPRFFVHATQYFARTDFMLEATLSRGEAFPTRTSIGLVLS